MGAQAQAASASPAAPDAAWQRCAALGNDPGARLACFDAWASQQAWQAPAASSQSSPAADAGAAAPALVDTTLPATRMIDVAQVAGCRDPQYSELSRFWELEAGSDCGTFSFRGYRPITASVVASSSVNRQPTSGAPDHSALQPVDYRSTEARIQLSVRTKLVQGLLGTRADSVLFGYSQQSYGNFQPTFAPVPHHRPRTRDGFVYPTDAQLPWAGAGATAALGSCTSPGQSLPLSRS
jgi:phospholipase A1